MRSFRAILPIAVLATALFASSPAAIATPVHGRGLHAEAGFDAGILGDGHTRIQILDQLCRNPDRERRCEPIRPALERAITRMVDRPISWVERPHRRGGAFWVLAPIRFLPATAEVRWAWRDLGRYGCSGGGRLTYSRERGAWRLAEGIEYEGCPAVAAGAA